MNKNIIILLVAALLFGSSCTDFLSVNEVNPNSASKITAELLLPNTLNSVARTMNLPRRFDFVYLWHGLWSISAGYSQPQNLVQYRLINSNYQFAFEEFYLVGQNLTEIENLSTDPKDANYLAIAKIMKAYVFQNLVDCWGSVPYTEAFDALHNLKPAYTDQKVIYEDLVVQLDAAMKLIQDAPFGATVIPASSDIMFGGNTAMWLKFANTLKLRILVHQSGMAGRGDSYIKPAIATTASIGYLGAGESGLVNPGYLGSETKMNPFYETFYNAAGTSQSDGITYYFAGMDAVDFYQNTNDKRVGKFFKSYSTTSEAYAGNVFGTLPADLIPAASTSQLGYASEPEDAGTMIGTPTKSAPLLTDFESLFIQAEAAQRGFIVGDANSLYQAAVTQSYIYMGLTSGDAANYLTQELATVSYTAASDPIELILTQKWAALNGVAPVEIWTDFRRSGFPSFIHWSTDPAAENPTPPIRLLYPQREISTNNDQLLKLGTIDAFTSKIFWQNR